MVSEKEIEAAIKAIEAVPIMDDTYSLSGEDAKAVACAALKAAARVREEANAEGGEVVSRCEGQLCYYHGCQHLPDCVHSAHPAPQPSGPVEVKPLANLIHDALAFAVWAAGEGLCPTDGPPAPEDFLYAYSAATGFENWDAIPHHVATTLSALTAGKPEQAVPSEDMICAAQAQISEGIGAYLRKFADSIEAKRARDYLHKMPESEWAGMTRLLAEESVSAALRAAPKAGGVDA